VIEELANQIIDHRAEVDQNLDKLDQEVNNRISRQKETLEQLNAKIVALGKKFRQHQRQLNRLLTNLLPS
jgi:uncharacterized coiled-coil protein SlyX